MGPDVVTSVAGLNYFRTALSAGPPRHETADQSRFLPLGLAMLYDGTAGLTLITPRVICYGEHKFITFARSALPTTRLFQSAMTIRNNYILLIYFNNLLQRAALILITFRVTLFEKYELISTKYIIPNLSTIFNSRFIVLYIVLEVSYINYWVLTLLIASYLSG